MMEEPVTRVEMVAEEYRMAVKVVVAAAVAVEQVEEAVEMV